MERLVSSGWALVIIGIGCYMLYEFFRLLKKHPAQRERDLVSFVVWPFTSPLTGVAAISLGAYVIFRDIAGWLRMILESSLIHLPKLKERPRLRHQAIHWRAW